MKKIILILVFAFVGVFVFGQDAYVTGQKSVNGFGTAGDTLTNAAVLTDVVRVKSPSMLKMQVALFSDEASGTTAFTAILMRSMDGINYVGFDTITHSGGGDDYGEFTAVDATFNFYKIQVTATAAAMNSVLYSYWNFRKQ